MSWHEMIPRGKDRERELLELNQSLERRVAERTAALSTAKHSFAPLSNMRRRRSWF